MLRAALLATIIVAALPASAQAQTATPTPTSTPTPTPTIIAGYAIDSFDNLGVNCFRIVGSQTVSCLPGTPIPGANN